MKKFTYFFMFVILIILVGCKKESKQKVEKKTIDNDVVQKIVGRWKDDSYDYGDYVISVDDKTIHFNSEILTIEYTENNEIYAHEKDDKKFHYDFVIEDEQIIIYPTYEIEQTSDEPVTGGDLAPITLKKNPEISTRNILGKWKSTESDNPAYIQISATFNPEQVELILGKDENLTDVHPITLILENKNSYSLLFLNDEKTMNYDFSNYAGTKMVLFSSETEKNNDSTTRPYILERVH